MGIRTFFKVRALGKDYPTEEALARAKAEGVPDRWPVARAADADVVSSLRLGDLGAPGDPIHFPVLDLDGIGVRLVDSSTPGHSHLFLDVAVPWSTYKRLLGALADAGILAPEYVSVSIERGHTAARLHLDKHGPSSATPSAAQVGPTDRLAFTAGTVPAPAPQEKF